MRIDARIVHGWEAVRWRRWVVVQLTLLGGLVGGLFVLHQQPTYAATASGIAPRSMLDRTSIAAETPGSVEFRVTDRSPTRAAALATSYARAFASLHPQKHFLVTPAVRAARTSTPWRTIALGLGLGLLCGV